MLFKIIIQKLIVLLFFIPITSFCQSKVVTGIVKDIITSQPVEGVSIGIQNTNGGTISNEEGKFRITLNQKNSVLNFSHLNFNKYSYSVQTTDDNLEILLEPKAYTLQEVVIRKQPINETVMEALKNSKKQLEKSVLLSTYYREFVQVNGVYTNFSDGLLDYNIKRKSGASDLYVNQSRAYELKDSATVERKKMTESIYFYDVRDAISDAYNLKKLKFILESKNYEYEIETKVDAQGNSIELVTIIPKKEVELGLYYGTVVYDVKTKLILEIDLKKSPDHKQHIPEVNAVFFRFKVNEESRKASFKIDGDNYILVYNQNKINIYIKMKDRFDDTFEFLSDLITTDYKEGEFDFDRSKRHKERSLFSSGNNFTEEYWKTKNIILLSDEEEKIIKSLD
ncbi:carboxypeptidase-like regulatory domain-containing protein [Flavobacterium sp.]|uniref:carboxypeptidase-like regulatory domain-containing protein n=1 Tax=Flavobacterium sp. TaxID=239 RepID=UPI002B4AD1AB|nr:carboxypeptidase-like regulatory domain-containing protein [Flavobacterium sp.]HLP63208.1 carboxypeptidase-like regulatory domain-containing protein [Flavobacterium sp.]